jgi:hypothetical protein
MQIIFIYIPDGPAIVRVNLFVRSIATISDIKMVSHAAEKRDTHTHIINFISEYIRFSHVFHMDYTCLCILPIVWFNFVTSVHILFEVDRVTIHFEA